MESFLHTGCTIVKCAVLNGTHGVPFKPAHLTVTYIEWHIPDVVSIQLILLMMSTVVLETCRELEYIYIRKKNYASNGLFTKTEPRYLFPKLIKHKSIACGKFKLFRP
jgi:hypothetical protein